MTRRHYVLALMTLLVPAMVFPCARSTGKPFVPNQPVRIIVDSERYLPPYENDPLTYTCIKQGLALWNGPDTPVSVQEEPPGPNETTVVVYTADAASVPGAQDKPQGWFIKLASNGQGYTTLAHIILPDNLPSTVGRTEPGYCTRIENLMAHELGHGYFGTGDATNIFGHWPDSIMQGATDDEWGGLDWLPHGPTNCDRDQEKFGRSYEGQTAAGGVYSCQPGQFQDDHGCPCSGALYAPVSMWAAYNHKPFGHIHSPQSGLHAPFSGYLDMHTTDVDGDIQRTDFIVNSVPLLTTYGKDAGFNFSVGPGSYYIQTAIYDNRNEYTMGTPKQIYVCGGPPPQVTAYHEVSGGWVNVFWQNPQPNYVGAYLVEGGTYPGGTNVGSWNVGNTAAWAGLWVGPVGSGTYYVRVKAWNPCGFAVASPELTIVVP